MPVFSVRRRESIPKEASWPSHAGTPCTSAKIHHDSNLSDEKPFSSPAPAVGWEKISPVPVTERSINLDLLRQVSRSMRIRCLILPNEDPSGLRVLSSEIEVVRGDIRNAADCATFCEGAKGAVLFHTAGLIHPRRVQDFYAVNVGGTENLLSAAIAAGVRRAVVVSSNSPVGLNPHPQHSFDESSPYSPYMNYGRSKMQMELQIKQLEAAGKIETVIVRPPWFYGPNQPSRQVLFFSMIRSGKVPIVGSGNNLRSMVYTDNLCAGLVLAGFVEKARGEIYWIADRRPYSMNEIVDTVERLLEKEFNFPVAHKRVRLPDFASEVAMLADATLQGWVCTTRRSTFYRR